MASSRSRKNKPVVMDGSLNDLIGLTPGFAFCAVVFAHLSISVSLIGRPFPESDVSVFVMFILHMTKTTEPIRVSGSKGTGIHKS